MKLIICQIITLKEVNIKILIYFIIIIIEVSPEKLTEFIKELFSNFSKLLFFANKTLQEIIEIDIVKSAMHERFRKYHKKSMQLESQLEDLINFSKTNREVKEMLTKQKHEIEIRYFDSLSEISAMRDKLEVNYIILIYM